MSWLIKTPSGVPVGARTISSGGKNRRLTSLDDRAGEERIEDPEVVPDESQVVRRPGRSTRSVPESSKSPYHKKGTKLQYKKDKPIARRGLIFTVRIHTHLGIYFEEIDGHFDTNFFELAP